MSERLYYTDPYTTSFDARVLEAVSKNQHTFVVLDQSYFYPNSGGQPADRGTLNGIPVIDVTVRQEDGAVLHVVDALTWTAAQVHGEIDWARRFDHMQQHTGQHILSRAFINVAEAETVSFHLSDDMVTIDIDRTDLTDTEIAAVEASANQVVWGNVPIHIKFVDSEQADRLPLRKRPPLEAGQQLRLVDIDGFDLTACGGTHVAGTGGVGLIKIVKQERRGGKSRIEFCCGGRAVRDYEVKNNIVQALMGELTTAGSELLAAVQKLKDERQQAHRRLKKQQGQLLQYEARTLLEHAEVINGLRLVAQAFDDKDVDELRLLAAQLTAEPQTVALVGSSGEKAMFVFKRSEDVATGAMNQLVKLSLQTLNSKAGGGTLDFAQGGGFPAQLPQIEQAITAARQNLIAQLMAENKA